MFDIVNLQYLSEEMVKAKMKEEYNLSISSCQYEQISSVTINLGKLKKIRT